jgi:hypothetical protein
MAQVVQLAFRLQIGRRVWRVPGRRYRRKGHRFCRRSSSHKLFNWLEEELTEGT